MEIVLFAVVSAIKRIIMEILAGAVLIAVIGTWARLECALYEIKRKK